MPTAYIIDDESHSALLLKSKITDLTDYFGHIEIFTNSALAYQAILTNPPDIIFTDIEMPVMNGIDILEKTRAFHIPTVCVTAFTNYSLTAIKQQVFDYILKPVKEEELLETINKFLVWSTERAMISKVEIPLSFGEILLKQQSKLSIATIEGINLVAIHTIVQVIGDSNYSKYMFENGDSLLVSKTLKHVEQQLDQLGFIRVHKSHLVNMVFVEKLITRDGGYLKLKSSELIPISRDKKNQILEWFKI